MVDTNQMNLYKLLPLPFKQEQCGQFSRITMGNPLGFNIRLNLPGKLVSRSYAMLATW